MNIDQEIKKLENELTNVRGTETEVYARIVGYHRSIKDWNKGKREEYNDRKNFRVPNSKPLLFYSEHCHNCVPVKKWLDENNIDYDAVDVTKNMELARKHQIISTPTLLYQNRKYIKLEDIQKLFLTEINWRDI